LVGVFRDLYFFIYCRRKSDGFTGTFEQLFSGIFSIFPGGFSSFCRFLWYLGLRFLVVWSIDLSRKYVNHRLYQYRRPSPSQWYIFGTWDWYWDLGLKSRQKNKDLFLWRELAFGPWLTWFSSVILLAAAWDPGFDDLWGFDDFWRNLKSGVWVAFGFFFLVFFAAFHFSGSKF